MKDAMVTARVEYDVKSQAEDILQKLGIPVSVAINSLYRQIIFNRGLPFPLVIPEEPRTLDTMSEAELNAKLQRGYEQSLRGEGTPASQIFAEIGI